MPKNTYIYGQRSLKIKKYKKKTKSYKNDLSLFRKTINRKLNIFKYKIFNEF